MNAVRKCPWCRAEIDNMVVWTRASVKQICMPIPGSDGLLDYTASQRTEFFDTEEVRCPECREKLGDDEEEVWDELERVPA